MPVITDSAELDARISPLLKEPYITVDTEFLRDRTYYPQLCLIQIGGKDDHFAVDPLADGLDLTPVWKLFKAKKVLKIFHACSQDMEIILQEMGSLPQPVFDTQIAAQFLGYGDHVGYDALVKKICNVELDKSSRHMDWSRRPLTDKQVDYALGDVTYLREIYEHMIADLTERGRVTWAEEEMEPLLNEAIYVTEPEDAWLRLKLRSGKPGFLATVRSVAKWRELYAQKINKPRNWVLKPDAIMEISAANPKSMDDMKKLRQFRSRNQDMVRELLEAVKAGKADDAPNLPKKVMPPRGSGAMLDLLKLLLKRQADEYHIAPSTVATATDMKRLLLPEYKDVPAMRGWRYDVFGKYVERLKDGKLFFGVEGDEIVIREES